MYKLFAVWTAPSLDQEEAFEQHLLRCLSLFCGAFNTTFLTGPDVTNILLQSQCSLDQGEHLSMAYDHIADQDVLNALDPAHPVAPVCSPVAPIIGG